MICPYCSTACQDYNKFRDHIKKTCTNLEMDCIPAHRIRSMQQQDFDRDPQYAALLEVSRPAQVHHNHLQRVIAMYGSIYYRSQPFLLSLTLVVVAHSALKDPKRARLVTRSLIEN